MIEPYTALSVFELVERLLLAAVLGAAIGVEREFRQKTAGLRTNTLIALGSALFTVMSIELGHGNGDPARIAAQIVTGIGFLGGGAILHSRGAVTGLTTAATVWVNAAVGVAAGGGRYAAATAAAATTLVVLTALEPVERFFRRRRQSSERSHPSARDATESGVPSGSPPSEG